MFTIISNISALPSMPDLLDPAGMMKLVAAADIDAIDPLALRHWCHSESRYGLPTVELIDWLRSYLHGRAAIEIGAGAGDLAFHLGIPATDSLIQNKPEIKRYYEAMGQPIIKYPAWVEGIDGLAAIDKYKPEVVIASWVTQWVDPNNPNPPEGSIFGVKEDVLLSKKVIYLFIGNLGVHRQKAILRQPHRELNLPFVRSRAIDPSLNRIFIWNE
jgi:hypothetical protein